MIREESNLVVADNTGAKVAKCFRVLGQRKEFAHLGDVIKVSIREATPTGAVKKGQVCLAVIVRTAAPIHRKDACVIVDAKFNPLGTRVFGPVARELRDSKCAKVVSMAPEVV